MSKYDVYDNINRRTGGEIYIGVVGPVRTGKSTFIKRFMDLLVMPNLKDEYMLERTKDELPQSAAGKTIMITEPKFIPSKAALVKLNDETEVRVRIIDSVGYMVDGASGHIEEDHERMVKTPWFDYEIPFSKAAEIGTKKVITDHSTIGLVITCDGSFGELPRNSYIDPERKTIQELKDLGKPFVVLLNTNKPYDKDTTALAKNIANEYKVSVLPVNVALLEEPEIIKNGNKFGIKIKAKAPSIHMIKADVLTEIAPIVGSEEQASDLMNFIKKNENAKTGIWDTNIFGKTIEQIVFDDWCKRWDYLHYFIKKQI